MYIYVYLLIFSHSLEKLMKILIKKKKKIVYCLQQVHFNICNNNNDSNNYCFNTLIMFTKNH